VFEAVSEDFAREQPDLVMSTASPASRAARQGIRLPRILHAEPRIRRRFENYEHLMDFDRYRIYRHKKKK